MSSVKDTIQAVPFVSIASTALTNVYQPVNPLGLPHACFLLRITNFGTTLIGISFDGISPYDQIPAGGVMEVYGGIGSSQPSNKNCLWAKGTVIYVVGTAGASGVIGVSAKFQPI